MKTIIQDHFKHSLAQNGLIPDRLPPAPSPTEQNPVHPV